MQDYPWDIPPARNDPPLTDSDALDQLAEVLGDQASSPYYVWAEAVARVQATGRTVTPVTGD